MSAAFTDVSAQGMVRAIEADVLGAWSSLGRSPGCETNQTVEATWMFTGLPDYDYNKVVRSQLNPGDADAMIEKILAYYASRKVPMSWWLGPSARPADLGARLEAHGMTHRSDSTGMALDMEELNEDAQQPSGLVIERVEDDATLAKLVHVSVVNFNLPETMEPGILRKTSGAGYGPGQRFRHYLGVLDGEPVATASMYLGDGVVSIQNITTAPQARRLGVGTAITMSPILEARDLGYRIASLQASKMGYSMYERMGFKEYMKFAVYVRMLD